MSVHDLATLNDEWVEDELKERARLLQKKTKEKCPYCSPGECKGRECSHIKLAAEKNEDGSLKYPSWALGGCV
jgi:hypothetical protein